MPLPPTPTICQEGQRALAEDLNGFLAGTSEIASQVTDGTSFIITLLNIGPFPFSGHKEVILVAALPITICANV